jgi:hypothetical protein
MDEQPSGLAPQGEDDPMWGVVALALVQLLGQFGTGAPAFVFATRSTRISRSANVCLSPLLKVVETLKHRSSRAVGSFAMSPALRLAYYVRQALECRSRVLRDPATSRPASRAGVP